MTTPAYDELARTWARMYRLGHLGAIASWDRAVMMPTRGNEARAAALAELGTLMHRMLTAPDMRDLLARAEQEPLDAIGRANLREMQHAWRRAAAVPEALVEAQALATLRCEHAWERQRPANDWAGFLGGFREVLRLAREEARCLGDALGVDPYDALLDGYEPGLRAADVERLFADLQSWLPDLVQRVQAHQAGEAVIAPAAPFPKDAQRALSLEVMKLLGFDFDAGRLDESAHPFSGGVPEDTRLTTRYREDDFLQSLMGTVHETGHARYEQNLPRAWLGQPVGEPRSMAVHESQSLAFEMQLGRSRAFAGLLAPRLATAFGAQPAFEAANVERLLTRVRPGLIRVDADEVTYPAHIVLRFSIERRLFDGSIEADDIPALWDEGMERLLGLDTRGNHRDGCLQDVHWSGGSFGYFPCYTIGAMLAAQWFAALRRSRPGLDDEIAAGRLDGVFDWLRDHVWTRASAATTTELVVEATGGPLDAAHFRRHLEARYLG
jgi:carboxypeptidase Taq